MSHEPLLSGVRVLDVGDADSDLVTRLFADLGADVLKVEAPGGSLARGARPAIAGTSIAFALHNAGKRCTVLDPIADREQFIALAGSADIVVDSGNPGGSWQFGTTCAALTARFPHLVGLSVTDFGTTGPRASWQATDAVCYALSSALSRSGPTAGTPILPPDGLATATAGAQAAWATLVAYYHRLRTGKGDYIDFSRTEAVVQALDPPFGSEGQAAAGQRRSSELWRGRPRYQHAYPIFACADGHVRICLLSRRQWHGMRAWLGEPEQFADAKFDTIAARYAAANELNAAISDLFAPHTMDVLVAEGQTRGVPISAVLSPAEAFGSEHFRTVGAVTELEIGTGATVSVPVGPFVVDGRRAGMTQVAPPPNTAEPHWLTTTVTAERDTERLEGRPLAGLRILDLGVIVAGGELGRLFADLGAEVIKIESAAHPDGLRQAPAGQPMSRSWALTHRNQNSLGLDLRQPAGAEIFGRLVAGADAVFANFKPGTLAALGFSVEVLRGLNPRIVVAESSAFGASGPWGPRMGYGPLVRATTGITRLWTSDDDDGFYDATTVFPDHVVARITAFAALATLIRRDRRGVGGSVHISQAEVAVNQLAATYVTDMAAADGRPIAPDEAVHAVYQCAGEDEWCVVSVRSDAERAALSAVLGSELPPDADALRAVIAQWTVTREKTEVAQTLQNHGVPAAPMNRAVDVLADPQLLHRKLFTDMTHPLFAEPMPTETRPSLFQTIANAGLRAAPMAGEHTREICQKLLGLDAADIDQLIAHQVLFTSSDLPTRNPK